MFSDAEVNKICQKYGFQDSLVFIYYNGNRSGSDNPQAKEHNSCYDSRAELQKNNSVEIYALLDVYLMRVVLSDTLLVGLLAGAYYVF